MVGTFGSAAARVLVVTASARTNPDSMFLDLRRDAVDQHGDPPRQQVRHDPGIAAIGHVHDVHAGAALNSSLAR
jgi:hypothetical protein